VSGDRGEKEMGVEGQVKLGMVGVRGAS